MATAAEILVKFRERFNEFASVSDTDVSFAIEDAQAIHDRCILATTYLVAHFVALNASNNIGTTGASEDGGAGELSSISDGSESASYKTQAEKGSEVYYTSTPYGRRFLELERRCPGRRISIGVY